MKKICVLLTAFIVCMSLCGCGSSSSSDNYDYDSDNYDYDKGYGYTAPKEGESFSDYVERQDPELYNSMQDRWNNLK